MKNDQWIVNVERVLEPVLPLFIEMRWQDLLKLRKCIELSDYDSLKQLSHRLMGTPGAFGFSYIVELAREMEPAIEKKDLQELSNIAGKFEKFMRCYQVKIDN